MAPQRESKSCGAAPAQLGGSTAMMWFAAKLILVFGLLLAGWPLYGGLYSAALRASGQIALGVVDSDGRVRLHEVRPQAGPVDTALSVRIGESQPGEHPRERVFRFSSRLVGFQPLAFFVALVVATPVGAKRRMWAIFFGLLLVHAFVLIRMATYAFAPILPRDTLLLRAARWCLFDIVQGFPMGWLVPVIVWVCVTFRRDDLTRLFGGHANGKAP